MRGAVDQVVFGANFEMLFASKLGAGSRGAQSTLNLAAGDVTAVEKLTDSAFGLLDQMVAAAYRQRHHGERGMLVAGRRKGISAEYV